MTMDQCRTMYATIVNLQEKYNSSLEEACSLYAETHKLNKDEVVAKYNYFNQEVEAAKAIYTDKLKKAIQKSKAKFNDLKDKKGPYDRVFEDWEREFILLTFVANPSLSKAAVGEYLTDVMPHRTSKAYLAFQAREGRRDLTEQTKSIRTNNNNHNCNLPKVGEVVDCTVIKILPYGAMLQTEAGYSGLLHKSEIRNNYVERIEDFVVEGQKLKAKVIHDPQGRISFSTKDVENVIVQPVAFKVSDAVSPKVSDELKKRYSVKDIKFSELPKAIRTLITELNEEMQSIQKKVDTLELVLSTVERESAKFTKLEELKKYLVEM